MVAGAGEGVAQSSLNRGQITYFIQAAVMTYCSANAMSLP
jgi:hypothetical protein